MAVAATFIAAGGTTALAQPDAGGTASIPATPIIDIDAAIPMPEPANVPPPTAADFTLDAAPRAAASDEPATTASTPPATTAPAATATTATSATPTEAMPTEAASDTPAADSAASATVAAADQPVADQLRDLMSAKAARYFDRKAERTAVEAFYKARGYAPLWTEAGAATARANSVTARLKDAAAEGLDPDDYPTPDLASAAATPADLADADLRLTASVLAYARHAQSGRMHYSQVSGDILYPLHPTDPAKVLANVSTAGDASVALASYNPPQKAYQALKAKLAELRGTNDAQPPHIEAGPLLRLIAGNEMADPRVPVLRKRLNVGHTDDTRYDADVAEAVRAFQRDNGLAADGVLGARTIATINGPRRSNRIDTLIVNMERWRWLPRDLGAASLGDAYVVLNIPDFTLQLKQGDATVWKTRVVVGKPGKHATPLLTETMKYITVNPTWNVPPSIVYNEYLPALQQDPTVLDRMGMKLVQRPDGSVHISQPPGERNALGRIRFNFPNKFLVYQHDTPDKNLFAKDVRAYSHGCMRVQNPDQYAAHLLQIALPQQHYTAEKIRSMYGSAETNINLPTPIPVHLTYQTAFPDSAGHIEYRNDIYNIDSRMIALLRGSDGKNLEAVVAHAQPNYSRPRVSLPNGLGNEPPMVGPSNFFEALFGGFQRRMPPPDQRRVYTR
jgi:murein L,D-transpeptidase YcbB/YkuD